MTGRDHTDALVEALRQPALPTEWHGEDAAIASMVGTLTGAAAPRRFRSRKGAVLVAVTAASLGVGGLAAAGPGAFPRMLDFGRAALPDQVRTDDDPRPVTPPVSLPAAVTSNPAQAAAPTVVPGGAGAAVPGASPAVPAGQPAPPSGGAGDDSASSCVADDHADLVVDAAQAEDTAGTASVPDVARPDCGKAAEAGPPASTPGNDDPGKLTDPTGTATGQSGTGQSGTGQSGTGQSGTGQSGTGHSNAGSGTATPPAPQTPPTPGVPGATPPSPPQPPTAPARPVVPPAAPPATPPTPVVPAPPSDVGSSGTKGDGGPPAEAGTPGAPAPGDRGPGEGAGGRP